MGKLEEWTIEVKIQPHELDKSLCMQNSKEKNDPSHNKYQVPFISDIWSVQYMWWLPSPPRSKKTKTTKKWKQQQQK